MLQPSVFDRTAAHASVVISGDCAHVLFERQAAATPRAVAVRWAGGEASYAELDALANRIARYLHGLRLRPGALIGVCMPRRLEMVAALLATWKAGAAYVPLDPAYPAERLLYMADDAGLETVLADATSAPLFGARAGVVDVDASAGVIAVGDPASLGIAGRLDDLAYVMYTSGSTGRPKGAMITQRGLVNYLGWAVAAYGGGGLVPVHSSISFDLTVTSLYPALLSGGTIELLEEDVGAQSLAAFLRAPGRRTVVKITPAHLELLSRLLSPEQARQACEVFVIGGEALHYEHLRFWRQTAPNTRLINEYGPTETVVGCCVHEVAASDPDHGPVPIGRAITGMQMHVLDAGMRPVEAGVVGEIWIGGVGVGLGYLGRADLSAERFVADPFVPGARLYRSGDLGRVRGDGIIEYLGRIDHQVKVNGYRIELGEIEHVLAGESGVRACAVDVRELGGQRQLVAYVVPQSGHAADVTALRAYLSARLPGHMVPSRYVVLDALPLNHNGKVDRQALPAPAGVEDQPRGDTAARLCAMWADILGVDHVGVDDDVFDLGASSLSMVAAQSRMREAFGVTVDLAWMFEHATVAEMALLVAAEGTGVEEAPARIERLPREAGLPLSYSQRRMWILHHFDRFGSAYNVAVTLRLRGTLDRAAMQAALEALVARHDALRTTFQPGKVEPVAMVGAPCAAVLEGLDSAATDTAHRRQDMEAAAAAFAARPYSLARGPLHRFALGRVDEQEHLLVLGMHHIVCDSWSWGILLGDLAELFDAALQGRAPRLAPKEFDFGDFVADYRRRLEAGPLEAQRRYWVDRLADLRPYHLPGAAAGRQRVGRTLRVPLGLDRVEALRAASGVHAVTPFMLLLAVFQMQMAEWCRHEDMGVVVPVACRGDESAAGVVGSQTNSVIIRTPVPAGAAFAAVLRAVRESTIDAFAHQDYPYDDLVAALRARNAAWSEPAVMFNVINVGATPPDFDGLHASFVHLATEATQFDLYLTVFLDAEPTVSLTTAVDLMDEAAARSLLDDYFARLDAALTPGGC